MGNFRGVYPRKAAEWRQTYWEDVTVQNYALRDLEAFVNKIREVKRRDLAKILADNRITLSEEELERELDKLLKITFVGHSMGGMTFYIYMVDRKLRGLPHHINEAILLSPGGFHSNKTLTFKCLYWLVLQVL